MTITWRASKPKLIILPTPSNNKLLEDFLGSQGDFDDLLLKRHGDKIINVTAGNETFSLSFESREVRKESDQILNAALKFIRKPDNVVVSSRSESNCH